MEITTSVNWVPELSDPTGRRPSKPRTLGKTMVIDKGLGLNSFEDLLQTAGEHIDMLKIGFGTSPLYPQPLLKKKIELAREHKICIFPGGTFIEVAVMQKKVDAFYHTLLSLGFTGVEVSDGTIEMQRSLRNELISKGVQYGLSVFTEYGKKCFGSTIDLAELTETFELDMHYGAELVTIEGRESGLGVGIFDASGGCKDEELEQILRHIPDQHLILWEAPHKDQQVHLMKLLGPEVHLGNIAPQDIISLEALRRGLRSDTFHFGLKEETAASEH